MKISRMKLWTALILFASAEMLYTQQHSTRLKTNSQDEAPLLSDSNLNAYRRFKRDSSDFLSEEFILSDIAHSIQTRASNDSLKSAVDRLQKIARILNGISLQQGLIAGSVPSDELISELLFFGSVTPSGIAKLDFEKIESAVNALKNLPNALAPTAIATKVEKALNRLEEIKKTVNGAGNLTTWDPTDFKNEMKRMENDGLNSNYVEAIGRSSSFWKTNYGEIIKSDPKVSLKTFTTIKDALEEIRNSISTFAQSLPLWKFNGFDTVMDGISPLTKVAGGVNLYETYNKALSFSDANNQEYVDFVRPAVNSITEITNLDSSLRDIKEVVATRERRSRQRNLLHTHGLSRGSSDVSQMMIDVSDQWIKDVLKTDGIRIAFKQFEEIIGLLNGMDRSLDFSGKGSSQINQFLAYRDRFADVMRVGQLETALPESLKCKITAMNSPGADKFNVLKSSLEKIDKELLDIKTQSDKLSKLLSTSGLSEMCDDVIKICEGADVPKMINEFQNYEKLSQLNKVMGDMDGLASNIKTSILAATNEAKTVNSNMTALDDYRQKHLPYADYFTCLQDQKQLDFVFNAIRDIQNIRKFQNDQSFLNSMKNGLEVVKKVIGSKDGLKTLKAAVAHMKGFQSPETLALKDLKNVSIHSLIIGSSVEGVSNMENALKQKSAVSKILENIQLVKINQQLMTDSEDVENLKALIGLEPVIQKMYQSLNQFSGVVKDSESPRLQNHSKIFKQAESVTGIKGNFLKMSTSIGKLQEKLTDPGDKKKLEDVESSLKTMDSMGLDFSAYQKSFKKSSKSLEALDLFFNKFDHKAREAAKRAMERYQHCPECGESPYDSFLNVDFSVITITFSSTVAIIVIGYITCYNLFRPDLSENFDSVEMTTPIGLNYYRSIYEKILNHKKSLRSELPTPGEDFYAYFRDHFDFDSKVSSGPIANFMTEKHANFQRFNIPISMFTRVKLDKPGLLDDFIHANMVDYPSGLKLIMTQGPQASGNGKESDIERMWWMVKQENVEKIVMLCQLEENGVTQCDQYYPENEDEFVEFNDLKIICLKKEFEYGGQIVIRRLSVKFKGEKKYYVSHYQYIGWPEKENPQDLNMIYVLLYEIRTSWTPVIVHCSDGIGRTGCFGYIEMGYQTLKREEKMEFGDILDLMRFERAGVVLNAKQYGFCAFMIGYYILKDKVFYFDDDDDKAIFLFLKDGYNGWDEAENKSIQKKLRKKEREISRMSKKLKRT